MVFKRWKKIEEDFSGMKDGQLVFDISKVHEICDNIVYDMIHYPELREDPKRLRLLYLAQLMCLVYVPCEYGITKIQKLRIGMQITHKLLDKIHQDLVWWKNQDKMFTNQQTQPNRIKDFHDEN